MAFYEVSFPVSIAFGSTGGPVRKTMIVTSASGYEFANAQWQNSRRRYDAGTGVKSMDDIHSVVNFFEDMNGRLHHFRWKDRMDYKSSNPSAAVTPFDQLLGTGDSVETDFQLVKVYGTNNPWTRTIKKPVAGTVVVSINDVVQGSGWSVDTTTGIVSFDTAPGSGLSVKAGFEFDVPVRFDADELIIDLAAFDAGDVPSIPLIEVRL